MAKDYIPTSDGGRIVGRLVVFRDIHWRTNMPRLEVHMAGRKATAHMETGELGGTVLTFSTDADRTFRTEVQEHLDKLKTLLILGG